MTEQEFERRADAVLQAIDTAIEATGIDIESSRSGPVLTIEFDDGSKIVINSQSAVRQIWVAARSGGFHYRLDGERWIDTRSGEELFSALGTLIGDRTGAAVSLKAKQ